MLLSGDGYVGANLIIWEESMQQPMGVNLTSDRVQLCGPLRRVDSVPQGLSLSKMYFLETRSSL
jgi:hypothetical protein